MFLPVSSYTFVATFHVISRFQKIHPQQGWGFHLLVLSFPEKKRIIRFFTQGDAMQKHKMYPHHATSCNDLAWVWLRLTRYSILPLRFMFVHKCGGRVQTLDVFASKKGIYANKIFSFCRISWHFLVDFVWNSVRKTFHKSSWRSWSLVVKDRSWQTCVQTSLSIFKAHWNLIFSRCQ